MIFDKLILTQCFPVATLVHIYTMTLLLTLFKVVPLCLVLILLVTYHLCYTFQRFLWIFFLLVNCRLWMYSFLHIHFLYYSWF